MTIKIIKKTDFKDDVNQLEVWDLVKSGFKPSKSVIDFLDEVSLSNKRLLKIIDLGCGNGRNFVKKDNVKYFGIDFSEKQLENAREYAEKIDIDVELVKGEIDKLDKKVFKNEMFDFGLFMGSLHCLESGEKRKRAVKEFYRVLKKGGEGLISVWGSEDKRFDCVNNHGDIYMSWERDDKQYFRYYYLFFKQELINLLEESGFEILDFIHGEDRFSRKNWVMRVKK